MNGYRDLKLKMPNKIKISTKIKLPTKLKLSTLMIVFIFQILFVRIYYISSYKIISNCLIIVVSLYLVTKGRILLNKKFFIQNFILLIFSILIVIFAFINSGVGQILFRTIFYTLSIIELFLLLEFFSCNRQLNQVFKVFYRLILFYVIINDIILIFFPNIFFTLGEGQNYLVGNKFNVGYLHIMLFSFSSLLDIRENATLNLRKKISSKSFSYFILTIIISFYIGCSTTVIGAIILFILTIFSSMIEELLSKKWFLLIILIISTFILLLFSSILLYEPIRYIIENVLGEDVGLTGRLRIYNNLELIIKDKLWIGYGYGESYNVLASKIHAPNTQNGVLECIFQFGLIGTTLYLLMIFSMFRIEKSNLQNIYPMLALFYMYVILSSVEITLGIYFLIPLAIINATYFESFIERSGNLRITLS